MEIITVSLQEDFEKELLRLFEKYGAELQESYYTPYQQSAYEIRVYDDVREEYSMIIEIDNHLIKRLDAYSGTQR